MIETLEWLACAFLTVGFLYFTTGFFLNLKWLSEERE